jgi:5'-nucleotidase
MNILLTNDDGINGQGLLKLAEVLRSRKEHTVYVLAPDTNRSGVSQALGILSGPLKLVPQGENAWSCSGNPSDCVIAAVMGGLPDADRNNEGPFIPDLVLSGINRGANLGTDIVYSGTAAAARQAAFLGIPGIALSLAGEGEEEFYWDMAAVFSADHLGEFLKVWVPDTFVNVNIPNTPQGPRGIRNAWPAVKHYRDTLKVVDGDDRNRYCFIHIGSSDVEYEDGSDCDVVSRNYAARSSVFIHPVVMRECCPRAPDHAAAGSRGLKVPRN